jgi:hypothetical protein|tara:strand:- start:1581 stop:1859 length:279 start_codon:yes stop_codon:yes gene_type:complete
MTYDGKEIAGFYLMDWDNCYEPDDMLKSRDFYRCAGSPHQHLGPSQMRDMINVVAQVTGRIGGYAGRISWFAELTAEPDNLIEITDPDLIAE